jgi:hypothetical protein
MTSRCELISSSFLKRGRSEGVLATAAERVASSGARYEPLPNMSTWALVCEEIVDTEYGQDYYERVVAELFRRGISSQELADMRLFAWQTAGWLNFEKMLCSDAARSAVQINLWGMSLPRLS